MRGTRYTRGVFIVLLLLGLWFYYAPKRYSRIHYVACQHLPGASDTVVIMKTGVTEIEERLPAHLETTLKCPPNWLIYSDHSELFHDKYPVHDVLANISPEILENNEDFELYRRVKEVGRLGLDEEDLTGTRTRTSTTDKDKKLIPGWVLDKWKFIPMMNETFSAYPNKKWYIFIESDSYMFFSTILKYVSTLDHRQPHCLGHRTTRLADHRFMQGGAGYVLSHEALRLVYHHIQAHHVSLDQWMVSEWAGDVSLGKVLDDVEVPLTYAWPIFQPAFFGITDFAIEYQSRRFWCYPAASYHHMTPETIGDMFDMEQQWLTEENDESNPYKFLTQGDVFSNIMLPRMRYAHSDWDNMSSVSKDAIQTMEECKQSCVDDHACVQYQFDIATLQCKISYNIRYGEPKLGGSLYSDWMFDRIEKWRDNQPICVRESFLRYGDVDLDL